MEKRSTAKPHAPPAPKGPAERHVGTIEQFKTDADLLCSRPVTADLIDLALTYWIGYPDWLSAIRGRRLLEDDPCPDWLYLEEQHLANVHQCALEALAAAAQAAGLQSDAIYESGQWCRRLCPSAIQWPTSMASTSAPAEVLGIVDRGYHQLLRLTNRATLPAAPEFQAVAAVHEPQATAAADPEFQKDDARHSTDYRSVSWFGTSYTFTKNQAACIKILWAAWQAGTPELDGLTVVANADVAQCRLIDVFRSKGKAHVAWGTMIVQGESKGAYRLSDGAIVAPPKPRRKESRKTTRKTHQ